MTPFRVILLMIILALAGYGWWWSSKADALEELVKANLGKVQADFAAQGGWMGLKYDSIETSNFPSVPFATIYKPCLHYNQPSARVMDGCGTQLVIEPENFAFQQFTLKLPKRVTASEVYQSGLFHAYVMVASDVPTLRMRLPSAELEEATVPALDGMKKKTDPATLAALPPELVHQYALNFPADITLSVTRDMNKPRLSTFSPPAMPLIIWRPVKYKLDHLTDLYFHLLAEIAEKGKAELPLQP